MVVCLTLALVTSVMSVCSKLHKYTPSAASKDYNKPVTRKSGVKFNPHQVVDLVRHGSSLSCKTQSERAKIVTSYIEVVVARVLISLRLRWFRHCTAISRSYKHIHCLAVAQ